MAALAVIHVGSSKNYAELSAEGFARAIASYLVSDRCPQYFMPRSVKPTVVKTEVISRHLQGDNNSLIARELDISRPTVQRILAESEIDTIVREGRSRAIMLIPRSLDVVENRLEKNDGSIAISLLRGTNVLMNQALTVNQNNIQANTWITMRAQRSNEETQLAIDVKPDEKPTE